MLDDVAVFTEQTLFASPPYKMIPHYGGGMDQTIAEVEAMATQKNYTGSVYGSALKLTGENATNHLETPWITINGGGLIVRLKGGEVHAYVQFQIFAAGRVPFSLSLSFVFPPASGALKNLFSWLVTPVISMSAISFSAVGKLRDCHWRHDAGCKRASEKSSGPRRSDRARWLLSCVRAVSCRLKQVGELRARPTFRGGSRQYSVF